MFCIIPEGDGKRTDILAINGAMKMIFGMNTNRRPSNTMLLYKFAFLRKCEFRGANYRVIQKICHP